MKLKSIIFAFIILTISSIYGLSYYNQLSPYFTPKPLNNVAVIKEHELLSWDNWLDESYQKSIETYTADMLVVKPLMVRLNREFVFKVLGQRKFKDNIIGYNNVVYQDWYIKNYCGLNAIGDSAMQSLVSKLQVIQDTLQKRNISLILVVAPSKASFYPEYIPSEMYPKLPVTNNVNLFRNAVRKTNLNVLDLGLFFQDRKGKTPYPLYTKSGVHYSIYGSMLCADTLLKFSAKVLQTPLPNFRITSIDESYEQNMYDNDLEHNLNLLCPLNRELVAWPKLKFDATPRQTKALIVADSYYNNMDKTFNFSKNVFKSASYWFYLDNIHYPNFFDVVKQYNVCYILATEGNMHRFGFGFIERLYGEMVVQKETKKAN